MARSRSHLPLVIGPLYSSRGKAPVMTLLTELLQYWRLFLLNCKESKTQLGSNFEGVLLRLTPFQFHVEDRHRSEMLALLYRRRRGGGGGGSVPDAGRLRNSSVRPLVMWLSREMPTPEGKASSCLTTRQLFYCTSDWLRRMGCSLKRSAKTVWRRGCSWRHYCSEDIQVRKK